MSILVIEPPFVEFSIVDIKTMRKLCNSPAVAGLYFALSNMLDRL